MSYVCAVTVFYKTLREEKDLLAEINAIVHEVQEWDRDWDPALIDVTDHAGGNKHPQIHIACAGINYFDWRAFLDRLRAKTWDADDMLIQVALQDENDNGCSLTTILHRAEYGPIHDASPGDGERGNG